MANLTTADPKHLPSDYESPRALWDVLIGEDSARTVMEASSLGDISTLQSALSQPQWAKTALEMPHCIYYERRPRLDENDVREVSAMKISNLERAIIKAAVNGHAAAVSALLRFASQQGLKPSDFVTIWVVSRAILNGHAAVIEALGSAGPKVHTMSLGHWGMPLDLAVARRHTEVVAVLLELGASLKYRSRNHPDPSNKRAKSYRLSLLSLAARAEGTRMTELFLKHGASVARSGALHLAAELGALDTMRLLMQHGADVNELLPADTLPRVDRSMFASWTPMHFAAYGRQTDAMKLLESNGARSDGKDENGRTPAQLLEEREQALGQREP